MFLYSALHLDSRKWMAQKLLLLFSDAPQAFLRRAASFSVNRSCCAPLSWVENELWVEDHLRIWGFELTCFQKMKLPKGHTESWVRITPTHTKCRKGHTTFAAHHYRWAGFVTCNTETWHFLYIYVTACSLNLGRVWRYLGGSILQKTAICGHSMSIVVIQVEVLKKCLVNIKVCRFGRTYPNPNVDICRFYPSLSNILF